MSTPRRYVGIQRQPSPAASWARVRKISVRSAAPKLDETGHRPQSVSAAHADNSVAQVLARMSLLQCGMIGRQTAEQMLGLFRVRPFAAKHTTSRCERT